LSIDYALVLADVMTMSAHEAHTCAEASQS
jgi:hypothetical protein